MTAAVVPVEVHRWHVRTETFVQNAFQIGLYVFVVLG